MPKNTITTIKPYPGHNAVEVDDFITIAPTVPTPTITFTPAPIIGDYKNCVIRIDGSDGAFEYVRMENVDGVDYDEEVRLREENTFVKELYEQYRVAVVLAHKGKYDGSKDST